MRQLKKNLRLVLQNLRKTLQKRILLRRVKFFIKSQKKATNLLEKYCQIQQKIQAKRLRTQIS